MARQKQLWGTKRGQKKKSRFLPYLFDSARARSLSLSLSHVSEANAARTNETQETVMPPMNAHAPTRPRERMGMSGEIMSGRDMTPVDREL